MTTATLTPTPSRPFFSDTVLASPINPHPESPVPPIDQLRIDGPVKLVKYLPADKRDAFIGPLHDKVEDTVRFIQRECPSLSQVPAESIIFRPRVKNTAKHTRGIPFRTQTVSLPTTWEPPARPDKLMVVHIDSKVPGAAPLVPESIKEEDAETKDTTALGHTSDEDATKAKEEQDQIATIAKIMTDCPPQKLIDTEPWSPALREFRIGSGPKTWDDLAAEGMLLGD